MPPFSLLLEVTAASYGTWLATPGLARRRPDWSNGDRGSANGDWRSTIGGRRSGLADGQSGISAGPAAAIMMRHAIWLPALRPDSIHGLPMTIPHPPLPEALRGCQRL
jgi:hypothetical protein